MNKLDRYDYLKLIEAKDIILEIDAYNYSSESQPLHRKLTTIIKKIDHVLNTELEPKLQEEYNLVGSL